MNRKNVSYLIAFSLWAFIVCGSLVHAGGSQMQPWPTDWSPMALASWSQPLLASGPVTPPVASAFTGEIFINIATAGAPTMWRKATSSWEQLSGGSSGSGSGVASHSQLDQLDFSVSGHTNFASSGALLSYTLSVTFGAHVASQTDPHGASMTVSQKITVGSGTEDVSLERTGTGTITIASFPRIPPESATPTGDIGTGTLWNDANLNKLRCYDGTTWQNCW